MAALIAKMSPSKPPSLFTLERARERVKSVGKSLQMTTTINKLEDPFKANTIKVQQQEATDLGIAEGRVSHSTPFGNYFKQ